MIKFFDACSGIGGIRLGLEALGWKCVGSCEIDKYALKTYQANFDTSAEFYWPDITKLDPSILPIFDVFCAGFPCQPFSLAGKRLGTEDDRGQIIFHIFRILRQQKPKAFLLENVKGLTTKTFRPFLDYIKNQLSDAGYSVYSSVLNSKDFGVPQHRERLFIVGFRGSNTFGDMFDWPEPIPLKRKLKDILQDSVDEKYYLSKKAVDSLLAHKARHEEAGHGFGARFHDTSSLPDHANTIQERTYKDGSENLLIYLAHSQANVKERIQSRDVSWTLDGTANYFGVIEPQVYDDFNSSFRNNGLVGTVRPSFGTEGAGNGTKLVEPIQVGELKQGSIAGRVYDTEGIGITPKGSGGGWGKPTGLYDLGNARVRRLTPRECARLQGFPESFKIDQVSSSQLYKQFGNAVTVPVITAIGRQMMDRLDRMQILS